MKLFNKFFEIYLLMDVFCLTFAFFKLKAKMVHIKTDEGHVLDIDDSMLFIEWKIKDNFSTLLDFSFCQSILEPSYWGDCTIQGTNSEYNKWIKEIARKNLK